MSHVNNGHCGKCSELFDRYSGFHAGLRAWFEALQAGQPDAHISAAGRGRADQEHFFAIGTSFAHYGQSAHNFNAAVDVWRLTPTGADWGTPWYKEIVGKAVDAHNADASATFKIKWPLQRNGKVMEWPHCEVDGWQDLVKAGTLKLVE